MQRLKAFVSNLLHLPARVAVLLDTVSRLESRLDGILSENSIRLQGIHERLDGPRGISQRIDDLCILAGRLKAASNRHADIRSLTDAEFKVFSQFGDDGIIQYLVEQLDIRNHTFVEFGVEDYIESNTRFLLLNNNWKGLVIDGSGEHIASIRKTDAYWRHDLTAVESFITAENINSIFSNNGFCGEIGLLSIDIDGNDYWVWRAINVIDPILVVCEFNAMFGESEQLTIPYNPAFQRLKAHSSGIYYGASLGALIALGAEKGYTFIGCNSNGNNAYFVRNPHTHKVKHLAESAAFAPSKVREARDDRGELTFTPAHENLHRIAALPLVNTATGELTFFKDAVGSRLSQYTGNG